ncbi:CvpA family protein [Persephonella sp.]
MLDLLLILFLIYLIGTGVIIGFTQIVVRGIGLIVSGYLSILFYDDVYLYIKDLFKGDRLILEFFSFLIVFISTFSVFILISRIVRRELKSRKKLSLIDKLTGAGAGFLVFFAFLYFLSDFSKKNHVVKELSSGSKILELFRW